VAGTTTYTLPTADGTSGQVLSTNGSGVLNWATVSGGGGSGWLLTGNANTTSANFLGTTDNQPLTIKIGSPSTQSGYLNIQGQTAFGYSANATGANSTAIGAGSSAANNASLALGNSANASVQNAIAIGTGAASSQTGAIAIGASTKAQGQDGIAIGNGTTTTNVTNAVAIGRNITASQTNSIILGNPSDNMSIGVGTTTPKANLDVNGAFKLGASGTVEKNVVSFAYTPPADATVTAGTAITAIIAATGSQYSVTFSSGIYDMTIPIPGSITLSGTQATVTVSPSADLPTNVSIASARLGSTSTVKIRFINSSTGAQTLPTSTSYYITITEF
jgi:hypothetical protein